MKKTIRRRAVLCGVVMAVLPALTVVADPPVDSDELFAATRATESGDIGGPFAACFDQMRAFACPIAASIPVVRDVVGRLSLELGIACPTTPTTPRG